MTLLELNAEPERLVVRLELENERLRPLRPGLLVTALFASFITRQATLQNAVQHLDHFLLGRLPSDLQQQRLRIDAVLDALLPQRLRDVPQRERLRHRRPSPANLPR